MIAGLPVGGCTAVAAILVAIVIYADLGWDIDKWLLGIALFFSMPAAGALIAFAARMFSGR